MILLTRLNGERFAVNVDLIERAETTPDTVLRMLDGSKIIVAESLDDVIDRVREFKASVLRAASKDPRVFEEEETQRQDLERHLRVVPDILGSSDQAAEAPEEDVEGDANATDEDGGDHSR